MQCKFCQSGNTRKEGKAWSGRSRYQRYRCLDCGRTFSGEKIPKVMS